jgi:hypothetical protein
MSVRVAGLDAAELKGLRKDPGYDGGAVILDGVGWGGDPGTPSLTNSVEVRSGVPGSPLPVRDVASVLAAVERLGAPVVFVAGSRLGATELAISCGCVATYVGPGTEVGAIDPAEALALGLAGRLTERVGAAGAARLLLDDAASSQPLDVGSPEGDKGLRVAAGLGLVRVADDPMAEARGLAERLDDPAGRLLTRSLAFAARSTGAQAAAYDAELLALLDQRDDPQTDR